MRLKGNSVAPGSVYRQLICTRKGGTARTTTATTAPLRVEYRARQYPHITARSLTSHLSPPTFQLTPSHPNASRKGLTHFLTHTQTDTRNTQPSPARPQPHRTGGEKKSDEGKIKALAYLSRQLCLTTFISRGHHLFWDSHAHAACCVPALSLPDTAALAKSRRTA